ncbi:MAG: DUF554 domain-containing protein [Fimbriimonadaceae bacterium]
MWKRLPARGTLLNTATVVVGSLIGLAIGRNAPDDLQQIALVGLGLVTMGIGIKMFLETKNILVAAISVGLGGVLGALLGIDVGLNNLAEWARATLGGEGTFNEGLITASVLFCVGPLTLLGCIQDGIEGKIDLLSLKSTLDLVAATFLAATLGVGVLVAAAVVLVFQGSLTFLARPLRRVAEDPKLIAEASAAGGALMLAIGLGLAGVKRFPTELFLPALVLAPLGAWLTEKPWQGAGKDVQK